MLRLFVSTICRTFDIMTNNENNQGVQKKLRVVRKYREDKGLSRERLAYLIGDISVKTLERWELEGVEPSMTRKQWLNYCQAIGIEWVDLPEVLNTFVAVA